MDMEKSFTKLLIDLIDNQESIRSLVLDISPLKQDGSGTPSPGQQAPAGGMGGHGGTLLPSSIDDENALAQQAQGGSFYTIQQRLFDMFSGFRAGQNQSTSEKTPSQTAGGWTALVSSQHAAQAESNAELLDQVRSSYA